MTGLTHLDFGFLFSGLIRLKRIVNHKIVFKNNTIPKLDVTIQRYYNFRYRDFLRLAYP